MGTENLVAFETARRVLSALATKRDPDPADVDKLRRLAPPWAQLPTDKLAANVMELAQTISAATTDKSDQSAREIRSEKFGRCGLRRAPHQRGANQLNRSIGKRRK